MTTEFAARSRFPDSNFKQPSVIARILCGPGSAVFLPAFAGTRLFPLTKSRGDGAPSGAPVFSLAAPSFQKVRAPLGAPSRRFLFPGSAFPGPRPLFPLASTPRAQHRAALRLLDVRDGPVQRDPRGADE